MQSHILERFRHLSQAIMFCVCLQLICGWAFADMPDQHRSEMSIWSAVSIHTTALGALSKDQIEGRQLVLAGFRYAHELSEKNNFALFYTVDVIPLALAFDSIVQEHGTETLRKNVYGFGASPIGFEFSFLTNRVVQPQLGVNGGFLHFADRVPTPVGTRWNFTATGTAGIRVILSHNRALDFGYMFHHISNGRSPAENPSLNTNVAYFGFTFL